MGNEGYDSFLEPKKESKKAACDVKVKLIKLGVALATRPRGTLIADQRRACAARPKGKNEESPGRSLLQTERFKFFPAAGAGRQCRLPV